MNSNIHIPVLLNETLEAFSGRDESGAKTKGTFVDCTLGGGGHSSALLEYFPKIKLLACDVNDEAILTASQILQNFVTEKRLEFFHGNFGDLPQQTFHRLPEFAPPWSGILMDLGYSSNQLEDPSFGLSFQKEGPLDMRLSRPPEGLSCWEFLNQASEDNLAEILAGYGEVRNPKKISRMILHALKTGEVVDSTSSLSKFLEKILPRKKRDEIHPATLVFQALRIAVNDELRVLDTFLERSVNLLGERGKLVVITFHSLEDRIVKRWAQRHSETFHSLYKKPVTASQEEVKANPRARSAKLRAYVKRAEN